MWLNKRVSLVVLFDSVLYSLYNQVTLPSPILLMCVSFVKSPLYSNKIHCCFSFSSEVYNLTTRQYKIIAILFEQSIFNTSYNTEISEWREKLVAKRKSVLYTYIALFIYRLQAPSLIKNSQLFNFLHSLQRAFSTFSFHLEFHKCA